MFTPLAPVTAKGSGTKIPWGDDPAKLASLGAQSKRLGGGAQLKQEAPWGQLPSGKGRVVGPVPPQACPPPR